MTEFRVLLEGGNVLVVTMEVEAAAEPATIDPTGFGQKMLEMFGLATGSGAPVVRPVAPGQPRKPAPPPEPTAEEWLRDTSRDALRRMR